MNQKKSPSGKNNPPALIALRRAAKDAINLARMTGTSAYVWRNGRIVDAAKHPAKRANRKSVK